MSEHWQLIKLLASNDQYDCGKVMCRLCAGYQT